MNQLSKPTANPAALSLCHDIEDYRIVADAAYSDLNIQGILFNSDDILPVSGSFRRKVYAINTGLGKIFLKLSPVLRKKDRLRFLMLPWRITTEWRNLSRLKKKEILAPERILFGYKGLFPNNGFFLVTKEVRGTTIDRQSPAHLFKLADFLSSLHARGILHRDIHPANILIDENGRPALLDVQEVYFLPWLPRRLKLSNLGQLWWHIESGGRCPVTLDDFLKPYNIGHNIAISAEEVRRAAECRRQRYYRSRTERCFKNSTEFQIIKNDQRLRGFRRRDFSWGAADLQTALANGTCIKGKKLIVYDSVCIKIHNKRLFHKDRPLASWKMARALDVRGINVPRALAYLATERTTYFLTCFYNTSIPLNDYFSGCVRDKEKKTALEQFAKWLRSCHDRNIWQRDFKSSNVLTLDGQFMLIDLDGVRICRKLAWRKKLVNLAQLNASVSNRLSIKDRLRFFHYYCQNRRLSKVERRRAYKKIWKITQTKHTMDFDLDLEKLRLTI